MKNEKNELWMNELSKNVTSVKKLFNLLNIKDVTDFYTKNKILKSFPLRVPLKFVERMKKNNLKDPLLLQILIKKQEIFNFLGFNKDPLKEEKNIIFPGLIKKYSDRVLLLVKTNCAINCRYCFRKFFPYKNNLGNKKNWHNSLNYIKENQQLKEIILSGGDPLMAKDKEINWLLKKIQKIKHIKRIRIHSRLPVVIPSRITEKLCKIFKSIKIKILLVTHINHAQEINKEVKNSMNLLKKTGIFLLNQSVLLRGVNDTYTDLLNLSNKLFEANILPYYLHMLDPVYGTKHFYVKKSKAKKIMRKLTKKISGFLVPKLVLEKSNEQSKTLIDLNL
ncbi:EF-P beta-lysylation protein EpmB [Buchnera aphidicola (Mindarus keteleerifoliae)]|uniref:EF-P beta-lysylation protein EpmB n=1 Tax=Buchnera aphidicola TaxID=9 RepID=UPI0031B7373B